MKPDDEMRHARRDRAWLRQYFWRAATICRRNGLQRTAVIIAGSIDALANSLAPPGPPSHARPERRAHATPLSPRCAHRASSKDGGRGAPN